MIYTPSLPNGSLYQGEILSNLVQLKLKIETLSSPDPVVIPLIHPYAILMSQDCDLDWDFRARTEENTSDEKKMANLLFCEVVSVDELRPGDLNSKLWAKVRQNKDERFHVLRGVGVAEDALGEGLPDLGVDFKRYFTVPVDEVYARLSIGECKRRCRLLHPYRDHLAVRFSFYQSRVSLPEEHLR